MRQEPRQVSTPAHEARDRRRANEIAMLRAFLDQRPDPEDPGPGWTVAELQRLLQVSRPTVDSSLSALIDRGLIGRSGAAPGHGGPVGRPAVRYSLHSRSRLVAGIDIGAHHVGCTVLDLSGAVVTSRREQVDEHAPPASRLATVADLMRRTRDDAATGATTFAGIACGVVGSYQRAGTVYDIRELAAGQDLDIYSLPGFDGIDIGAELSRTLGGPAHVLNDMQAALLAESWDLGARTVIYLHAGRRMGAAVMIDGRIHHGRNDLAGSIGVLPMFEWTASLARLQTIAESMSPVDQDSEGVSAVMTAARDGHQAAVAAIEGVAGSLALAAAAMALTVDPDLIIVGGGLSRAGDTFTRPFEAQFHRHSLAPVPVTTARHGDRAVMIGAGRLAWERIRGELLAT